MGGDQDRIKSDEAYTRFVIEFRDGVKISYVARYLGKGSGYHPRTLSVLNHAYASTAHGAQGSEWEHAIVYLPPDPNAGIVDDQEEKRFNNNFLNYQLVYVMITRPRKSIFLIGDVEELTRAAVRKPARRWDCLPKRIRNALSPPKTEHL